MKNLNHLSIVATALLVVACGGPGSKQPVSDIQDIREKSTLGTGYKPGAPREIPKYIETEKKVIQEQATLNESYIKVEVDKKDMPLRFYENTSSKIKFYLRILDPSLKMTLTGKDLPPGAKFINVSTPQDPDAYELTWTPPLYTISFSEETPKVMTLTLLPVVNSAKTPAAKVAIVQKLFLEKVFAYFVFRTQEKPSELVISGLSGKAEEGLVTPFSVEARIPGIDDRSAQKPTIGYFKDNINQIAGTNYLEMDGVRHIKADDSRAEVEYLGDFKWKFNLLFDAKNIPVEIQKDKSGKTLEDANETHVRFGLKVYAPFNATNTTIVKIAIKRQLPPKAQ